jgi:hypothetical protein
MQTLPNCTLFRLVCAASHRTYLLDDLVRSMLIGSGMNDLTALLQAADRMGRALEDLRAAINDLDSPLPQECPLCHDCGKMFDRHSGFIVPCVCREAGLDEQREARGN